MGMLLRRHRKQATPEPNEQPKVDVQETEPKPKVRKKVQE